MTRGAVRMAMILAGWACLAWGALPPRLECDNEWNFGTVSTRRELRHVMTLRNAGGEPLVIQRVRACCGAVYTLSADVIPPGKTAELRIDLSLTGRTGPQARSLYIVSNDPASPVFQIRLTGTAAPELQAVPDQIDFGNIDGAAAAERAVRVTAATGGTFAVESVTSSVAWATCRWEAEAGGTGGTLRVRTAPPLPSGALAGRVFLKTGNPGIPELEVAVSARVESDVVVVVPAVIAVRPDADPRAVRYVAVRRRGGKPFKVLDVTVPQPGMRAEVSALGSDGYRVAVSGIDPARLDGKSLIVHTDLAGMAEIVVPFRLAEEAP